MGVLRSSTIFVAVAMLLFTNNQLVVRSVDADGNYFPLAPGVPLSQNWTDIGLISANDNWSGVPSINGYRGDDNLNGLPDLDPQTIVADYSGVIDVNANQSLPNTFATAGVTEFEIANPVVALSGIGNPADFPHLDIRINTSACNFPGSSITVSYNLRDLDGSADNAVQQVALQYRVGSSGNYTNVPSGYVADATTGPSIATLVTPISVGLPSATLGQPQVHVRVLTTNASGNDEWVGVDDINVACSTPTAAEVSVAGRIRTQEGRGIAKAVVTVTSPDGLLYKSSISSGFGYFRIEGLTAGSSYIVSVRSKSHTFITQNLVISPQDNIEDLEFVASP